MALFEKFPLIAIDGYSLVWDSRQPLGKNDYVYICSDLDPTAQAELKARPHKKLESGTREKLGEMCSEALGSPSASMRVWGVTGTNGKTTTVTLLRQILCNSGRKVAQIGTLGLEVFDSKGRCLIREKTGFTTPDAPALHAALAKLKSMDVQDVCMEVSSHAIVLGRIGGVQFDGAIFTNLSQDHLDFHKTMKDYGEAKSELFFRNEEPSRNVKDAWAVINADDAHGKALSLRLVKNPKCLVFSRQINYRVASLSASGTDIEHDGKVISSPMVGLFNAENMMAAALLAAKAAGTPWPKIVEALKMSSGVPGRLERVPDSRGRHVFVDYAHTPDALKKALAALSSLREPSQKIVVLFGCGGDRDREKRPLMGAIASQMADKVYLTSDNPRSENPDVILHAIEAGVAPQDKSKVHRQVDRRQAIEDAIRSLSKGDLLLVAGKGHEEEQIFADRTIPFSDRAVCLDILQGKRGN